MVAYRTPTRAQGLGIFSLIFGVLGLALCWWTPAGMVLSLVGLMIGLIGVATARPGGRTLGAAGLVVSSVALVVCGLVAAWGMELIRFGGMR